MIINLCAYTKYLRQILGQYLLTNFHKGHLIPTKKMGADFFEGSHGKERKYTVCSTIQVDSRPPAPEVYLQIYRLQ